MSLYDISNRYKGALSLVENGDMEYSDVVDTLTGIEGEFKSKALAVAMFSQNLLVSANAKKELAKKLIEEAKTLENKNNQMLYYLHSQMTKTGINKIECDYFKIQYRKLPDKIEIIDENKLNQCFFNFKTIKTPDKKAIKTAMSDGLVIDGAVLMQNREKLEIK